jgi:hypothetical protein
MKIKGPVETPPSPAADSLQPAGVAGADQVSGTAGAGGSTAVGEVGKVGDVATSDAVRAIAEDLRAGRISPHEAVERIVDRTVEKMANVTSPEGLERMRAALLELAERDPYLQSKLGKIADR